MNPSSASNTGQGSAGIGNAEQAGSVGQASMASGTPSPSVSVSEGKVARIDSEIEPLPENIKVSKYGKVLMELSVD